MENLCGMSKNAMLKDRIPQIFNLQFSLLNANFPILQQDILVGLDGGFIYHHIEMNHTCDGSAIAARISAHGNVDISEAFFLFFELSIPPALGI